MIHIFQIAQIVIHVLEGVIRGYMYHGKLRSFCTLHQHRDTHLSKNTHERGLCVSLLESFTHMSLSFVRVIDDTTLYIALRPLLTYEPSYQDHIETVCNHLFRTLPFDA